MAFNEKAWHVGFKWTIGDEDNPTGAICLDDSSDALHICEIADATTNWNVSTTSHPTLYIHSATTPATDYISMYHDGDYAYLTVDGTTLLTMTTTSVAISCDTTIEGDVIVSAEDISLIDDMDLEFGSAAGGDTLMRWSKGDDSNHAFVIGLGDDSQQMHITDKGAVATDWTRTAGTHPELAIHSNLTPLSDYLAIGNHDGTTAHINVVGGTTLSLDIAGTAEYTFTASSVDFNDNAMTEVGDMTFTDASVICAIDGGATSLIFKAGGTTGTTFITLNSVSAGTDNMVLGKTFFNDVGGEYIEGNGSVLTLAGIINITDSTEATTTSAAALVVTGGIANGGDCYFGDDVFLSSGAVINFNAGNVTMTHSADTLTVTGATIDLTASTKIDLDGATDITGALRLDSNTIANGAAFTVGTSGSPLDYTATSASSSGMQIHLTTDHAGTASSMKGADVRVTQTAGTTGSLIGFQVVSTKTGGDTLSTAKEHWGINCVVQMSGSTAKTPSVYGIVGDIDISGTVTVGAAGGATNVTTAGFFRSDVADTVTVTDTFEAPLIALVKDCGDEDRNKADAAIMAILGGDSGYSVKAGAAFKVIDQNTTGANAFDYGLDLYYSSGSYSNIFTTADIRLSASNYIMSGTGDPNGSVTGVDGSVYIRQGTSTANTTVYVNTNGTTGWTPLTG